MEVTKANYVEGLLVTVTFESGLEEGDGDDINKSDSDSDDEQFDLEFEDEVDIGITEYLALHLEDSSGDS
ncbi:hypothetical protein PQX77_001753, partial [Marasmius sp. AFHP31]